MFVDPDSLYYVESAYPAKICRIHTVSEKVQKLRIILNFRRTHVADVLFQRIAFALGNPYCIDAAYGFVGLVEYRKVCIYDERECGEVLAESPAPDPDDATLRPPKKIFEHVPNISQVNDIAIRKCQGRLVAFTSHNGGGVSVFELEGDYDINETVPEFPQPATWVFKTFLSTNVNVNSAALDPSERVLICGCDRIRGPIFVSIDRADGEWKLAMVPPEDPAFVPSHEAREHVFVPFSARPDDIPDTFGEEMKAEVRPFARVFAKAVECVELPPSDFNPFPRNDMDSLAVAWCPWMPNFCASVVDQSMFFLWDYAQKKAVQALSGAAHVPTGNAYRPRNQALSAVVFSHLSSVPRTTITF